MAGTATVADSRLNLELSDDAIDMEVYESLRGDAEPALAALEAIAAAGSAEEYDDGDDEFVNYEDPYLQGLLGPAEYD